MKKTKYRKISEGVFEEISETEEVVGIVKLEDLEHSRDIFAEKLNRIDELIKLLKKLKKE